MTDAPQRPAQYISFSLAGEAYAVDILRTREIVAYDVVTRVPLAPPGIQGVMNLRGQVIPVIDLARRLGLPSAEPNRWTCILLVDHAQGGDPAPIGLIIDAVSDVLDLSPAEVEPPPTFGLRVRLDYLAGMGKIGKKIVLLLDIDRILSPDELLATASVVPELTAG